MAGLRFFASSLFASLAVAAASIACDAPGCGGLVVPPAYLAPAAYSYAPAAPGCPCTPAVQYACPTPAPASPGPGVINTHEPALAPPAGPPAGRQNKGPMIYQNRTFGGVPQITEPRTALCKVTFWNLSGRDLNLSVGSHFEVVRRDQAVSLDLARNFSWRTNNQGEKAEEVPDDMNHFEVMIR